MKITKRQLKRIIKEEITALTESRPGGYPSAADVDWEGIAGGEYMPNEIMDALDYMREALEDGNYVGAAQIWNDPENDFRGYLHREDTEMFDEMFADVDLRSRHIVRR